MVESNWVLRVLEAMRVPGLPRVFVLGCFERRVTLYSQQVRALNLVDALFRSGELAAGTSVAVVGAGVAGLTFAAGAARRGARVTVLERADGPLSLFRKKPKRYLHPRVYDWPLPGWKHARAGLPVLDWEAGTVEQVAEQLATGWEACVTEVGERLRPIYRAEEVLPMLTEGGVDLSWNAVQEDGSQQADSDKFALVVLAVGFGLETAEVPDYRGYWDPDDLDVYEGFDSTKQKPREWLVSGCGDGALTDLMRLCIRDFRHDKMVEEFALAEGVEEAAGKIKAIEHDPKGGPQADFLFKEYKNIRVPKVINQLLARKRDDALVTLNVTEPYFLQANSSALNRFIVAQLSHAGRFRFLRGRIKLPVKKEGDKLRVEFDDGRVRLFDRVVLRHGPKPALNDQNFPAIYKACAAIREHWKQAPTLLDQTRKRYWERGIFGPEDRFDDSEQPPSTTLSPPAPQTFKAHYVHALEPAKHFQGRTSELMTLATWLDDSAPVDRVFALAAIGGTGKTALADQVLKTWLDKHGGREAQQPFGVLIWSFYENDRVDEFLDTACEYFAGAAGEPAGRLERLKNTLRGEAPHLLVLDGLERVQTDRSPDRARGQIEDPGLRTLLALVAAGHLGRTRVLVTSRFKLCDLEAHEGKGYREISLEDLDLATARAVLRAWGVQGEDALLDGLSKRVHGHALSVSVLGSYIAQFGGGDPQVGLALDLGEVAREASESDKKATRLNRLLEHYATRMPDQERELMARLSMFPRGVAVNILSMVVDARGKVAGVLVGCNQARLSMLLEKLVKQGLAFAYTAKGQRIYTAHPFLRDAFKGLAGIPAQEMHEAVRQRLAPSLEARPGEPPRDPEMLDRYEELIEHSLLAGKVQEAFELYWRAIGNYSHLGHTLGDYARGKRILEAFAPDGNPARCAPTLSTRRRIQLVNEWGLVLNDLGDLRLAARCFAVAIGFDRREFDRREDDWKNLSMRLQNAVETDVVQGQLPAAAAHAKDALDWARKANDQTEIIDSHAYLAHVRGLEGAVDSARTDFAEATRLKGAPLDSGRGLWEAELALLLGDRERARAQTLANLKTCEKYGYNRALPRLHTFLGEIALPDDPAAARDYLWLARTWTARTGDMEVILRAHQLAANIALAKREPAHALTEATEGLTLADTHGYGLHSIHLRLAAARAHLALNQPSEALPLASDALTRASAPECAYAWGHADALHLLGLIQRALGQRDVALKHFEAAATLRARIEHPGTEESKAEAMIEAAR